MKMCVGGGNACVTWRNESREVVRGVRLVYYSPINAGGGLSEGLCRNNNRAFRLSRVFLACMDVGVGWWGCP